MQTRLAAASREATSLKVRGRGGGHLAQGERERRRRRVQRGGEAQGVGPFLVGSTREGAAELIWTPIGRGGGRVTRTRSSLMLGRKLRGERWGGKVRGKSVGSFEKSSVVTTCARIEL